MDLCMVQMETHASAKDRFRSVFKAGEAVCFAFTIPTMAMVIFVNVQAAMVIITISCMALPRSFSADKIFTPTIQKESTINRIPVIRLAKSSVS